MAAAKKQCFLRFLYILNWVFTSVIQSPRFINNYKFGISVNTYQLVDIPNLNFAHHFDIYWLFQNGANKNQHQVSY